MRFLPALLRRRQINPQPDVKDYPPIAEIPCNDGFSIVVRAYDSTLGVNGRDEFIRRYPLSLKGSAQAIQAYVQKNEVDPRNILSDGTVMLLSPVPGQVEFVLQWIPTLATELKEKGITLPEDAVTKAIFGDMDAHTQPAQPEKKPALGR